MGLIEQLPGALRGEGPHHLLWWQWLALPVLVVASWVAGMFLGRVARSLLALAVRRTRFSWDDQIVAGLGGPLTLLCTAGVARVAIPFLELPAAWQGPLYIGLRTTVV